MIDLTDRQRHVIMVLLDQEWRRWDEARQRSIAAHGPGHWDELDALERQQEVEAILSALRG